MFWQIEEVKEVKKELPITTLKSVDFWYYSPSTGLYIGSNMDIIIYKDLSNGTYFSSVTDIEVKGNFIFWDKKIQNGKQKCRISILDLEEIDIKKLPFVPPTNIKSNKEEGWYYNTFYFNDNKKDGFYYIYFKIINNELVAVYSQKGERFIDKTKYLETFKKTKKYKVDSNNTINFLEKKLTEYLKIKEDGWYKNGIFYFKSLNNELVAVYSERINSFIDITNYQDIFKKLDNDDKINSPNLINFLQKKLTV